MLVGLVPGYATIGFWGAIILTLLRVIQGIGVGGEWGGSVLLALEWGHKGNRRGFLASWPQYGVPIGLFLADLALIVFGGNKSWFLTWGWRIPFLLSGILIIVGLYIRLRVMETPTFKRLAVENRLEKAPLVEVVRLQWPEVLKGWFVRMSEQAPFYIFTTFALAYGTKTLHFSNRFMLYGVMATCVIAFITYPLFGWLSDVVGRKPVYLAGIVGTAIWGFVYFGLLDSRIATVVFLTVAVSLIPHDAQYAPQAALISEQFTPRLRYSGAGLAYQLSSLTAGGPAPIIASLLLARFHTVYAIAAYILFCAIVSVIALIPMRDRTREDITEEYAEVGGYRFAPEMARRRVVE
jgi:MFS family permease